MDHIEEIMRSIEGDPQKEILRVAETIMKASEDATSNRLLVGAGLTRAFAGYWASFAVDSGDGPLVAAEAVLETANTAALLAARLVDHHYGSSCCRVCGCTDNFPCEGGCWRVEPTMCSNCLNAPRA